MRRKAAPAQSVFLNLPYTSALDPLLLALVTSVIAVGRTPRVAVEASSAEPRLLTILELINSCAVSIHELTPPAGDTRLNMALELGTAVQRHHKSPDAHMFVILESEPFRLSRTLSDMSGYDPKIHDGTEDGVIKSILDSLPVENLNPSLIAIKDLLTKAKPLIEALIRTEDRETILTTDTWQKTIALITSLAKLEGLIT